MTIWKRGSELSANVQREILERYVYRWTHENPHRNQAWTGLLAMNAPTVPLKSDAQWLNETLFPVTRDGRRLDNRTRHCRPAYRLEDAQ